MAEATEKSSRRFSKRMLMLNAALTWGAIYFAILHDQGGAIAAGGFALIGALYGAYTGVGHLDYRSILAAGSNASAEPPSEGAAG